MSHDKQLNIFQRLLLVQKAIPYVMKDSKVTGGGVRRDRVVGLVHDALISHGVYAYTTQEQGNYIPCTETSSKGTPKTVYAGRYTTHFVNVDSTDPKNPEEVLVTHEAQGDDFGDKALGKAATYAEKLNLVKGLLLETGTDDEGRLPDEGGDTDDGRPQSTDKAPIKTPKATAEPAEDPAVSEAKAARAAVRDALAEKIKAAQAGESKGAASAGMVKQINLAAETKKVSKVIASALKVAELTPETYPKEVGSVLWAWVGEQPDTEAAE